MFEFNHVNPLEKHPDYDNVIQRVLSTEQLDEVDKCILLCRECHGILHAQNIAANVLIKVKIGTKKAEQRLKGQLIVDRVDRRATFLTNERVLIYPYRVSLGGRKPRIHFGTELDNGLIGFYMKKLAEYKTMVIRSWNKTEMMRAVYERDQEFRITHDIRFPLVTLELCDDDPESVCTWVRNGVLLTKDGKVFSNGTVKYEGCFVP